MIPDTKAPATPAIPFAHAAGGRRPATDAAGRFTALVRSVVEGHADRLGIAARFGERVAALAASGGHWNGLEAATSPIVDEISLLIDDQRQALLSGAFGVATGDSRRVERAGSDLARAGRAAARLYAILAAIERPLLH
jgi:hypothetical protein